MPPLFPTDIVEPIATWCPSGAHFGKRKAYGKGMSTTDRARMRAKTFPGVAKAMSEQWGGIVAENEEAKRPVRVDTTDEPRGDGFDKPHHPEE